MLRVERVERFQRLFTVLQLQIIWEVAREICSHYRVIMNRIDRQPSYIFLDLALAQIAKGQLNRRESGGYPNVTIVGREPHLTKPTRKILTTAARQTPA